MALLIDFIESSASYIHERKDKLEALQKSYRLSADPDIKKEMFLLKKEIGKKNTQIRVQILLNLDELRYLNKYYPDLLAFLMEDDCVGKTLSKKAWLLDFHELPANFAASKLSEIRNWRMQLRLVQKNLKRYGSSINIKNILSTYPFLTGFVTTSMQKEEIIDALKQSDRALRREGWLVLLSSSLIQIPLSKFVDKLSRFKSEEYTQASKSLRVKGKGTIAEVSALRGLQEAQRKREHLENIIMQILLSNPDYLRALKKKALSSRAKSPLMNIAKQLTPHSIHERSWLDEMKKRVEE